LIDSELKGILERKVLLYNTPEFIAPDPVSIPHGFTRKEDIEIAGFLTALISWGRRPAILKAAVRMMHAMDNAPYEFVTGYSDEDLKRLAGFVYRTFNDSDLLFLVEALRWLYREKGGLETVCTAYFNRQGLIKDAITGLRKELLRVPHLSRSEKHLAAPEKGSAAKRINMFLRWMVRKDNRGVDFGLWKQIPPRALMIPLDVHSGNTARKLGLLKRKQNDWKAVEELTARLRIFDAADPVKYDYALFGTGIYEKWP
jgi:uncharacterized protein (TIGR02757 family)